ncbi:MAG: peptidoglycan-associated lipoprotein Pal [Acidobacteriota bacterium]
MPTEAEIWAGKTVDQLMREGVLADVYFDLDAYGVREDGRAPLQANAEYMKKWQSLRITVEGHCDERGTAEYNLALGERRSSSVKGYLVSLGIAADRITVISKGKETPFCTEGNEACWQQNRRGHFVITGK